MNSKSIIFLLVLFFHGICVMQLPAAEKYTKVITSCETTQHATVYPSKSQTLHSKSQLSCYKQETPMPENIFKEIGFELLYAFKL
ncbi:hypothetical protein L3Y34_011387 [Caenorhabditis briggsae]|nr:hypothetical protein L3Y34_011387 [Caenorhabditis briggsae]